MRPTVSAALIVRNEARFLPGCLESVLGAVDEIVVVDTGSSDDTIEIARSFGAKLIGYAWRDDFAAARNVGLDAAASDWILYIDADERLTLPPGVLLTDGLDDPRTLAARVLFRPRVGGTPARELRLFRNRPELRFRFAMHETMVPALEALAALTGGRTVLSPAEMVHLGYEGDQSAKHRRNLPLLRAAVAAAPDRLYFWHHLAETLAALDQPHEALIAAEEGMVRARARPLTRADAILAAQVAFTTARLQHAADQDAMPAINSGLMACPEHRALLFLKTRVLIDHGACEEALAILDRLRFDDGPTFMDPDVSYDARIFGAYAHDLAGIALLRLGRRVDAARSFGLAAAAAPEDQSYRIKAAALA